MLDIKLIRTAYLDILKQSAVVYEEIFGKDGQILDVKDLTKYSKYYHLKGRLEGIELVLKINGFDKVWEEWGADCE